MLLPPEVRATILNKDNLSKIIESESSMKPAQKKLNVSKVSQSKYIPLLPVDVRSEIISPNNDLSL